MTIPFSTFRPHPWHGLEPGPDAPHVVNVFVEITPFDLVKYEVDKASGYLKVDRAQKTSSLPPCIYGFIPQTYAGDGVAALMPGATNGGDRDPLDICVLSERPISRSEVLLSARVVGGLPMLDKHEADDKIVAVLLDDPLFGSFEDVDQVPGAVLDRLIHYFKTYKLQRSGETVVSVGVPYGRAHAEQVIVASMEDYRGKFAAGE